MKILAIDTSLAACSAAIVDGKSPVGHRFELIGRGHGEVLIPIIDDLRAASGLDFGDLDLIAVSVGPGSFTGVRVGIATARALALAADIPTRGFVSLEIIAAGAVHGGFVPAGQGVTAVIDARRGEVYHQSFGRALIAATAPALSPLPHAAANTPSFPGVLVGTGAEVLHRHLADLGESWTLSDAPEQPDARVLARMAWEQRSATAEDGIEGGPVRPLYLRAPDAKLPGAKTKPLPSAS
jgi:tRNA threonylcarbamoyladenosine biosynthesis protein TsaB